MEKKKTQMKKFFRCNFLHLTLIALLVLSSACASSRYRRFPYARGYFAGERGYAQPYPAPIAPLPPVSYEETHYIIPVGGSGSYGHPCGHAPYPTYPVY